MTRATAKPTSQLRANQLIKTVAQTVMEDLRLALFIAGHVLLASRDKLLKFLPARHGGI